MPVTLKYKKKHGSKTKRKLNKGHKRKSIIKPKSRSKSKRNKQKGGRVVPITNEQITSWHPLACKTGMDCGPNVFNFLGYTDRTIAEIIGTWTTLGTKEYVLQDELTSANKEKHAWVPIYQHDDKIPDSEFTQRLGEQFTLKMLETLIPFRHGCPFALYGIIKNSKGEYEHFGHYVVLARKTEDNGGGLVLIDPQMFDPTNSEQGYYDNVETISKYLLDGHFVRGSIIVQESIFKKYFKRGITNLEAGLTEVVDGELIIPMDTEKDDTDTVPMDTSKDDINVQKQLDEMTQAYQELRDKHDALLQQCKQLQ